MIFIILIILAVVAAVGINALLHPEKKEKARAKLAAEKEAGNKAKARTVYKRYAVTSEEKRYDVVEYQFEHNHYKENDFYRVPMKELAEIYDEGQPIYKWNIDLMKCRADLHDSRIDVYGSADGEQFEYIGYIPDTGGSCSAFINGAELSLFAEGGTAYEFEYTETQRRRRTPEKYLPWKFTLIAEKLVDNGK